MFRRRIISLLASCALICSLPGCGDNGEMSGWMKATLCAAGGIGGGLLADRLADKYLDEGEYSDDVKKALIIGTGLALCGAVTYAGSTIYKSMSESGREEREKAHRDALNAAASRNYVDPQRPGMTGEVSVVRTYEEDGRVCRETEDSLSYSGQNEGAITHYCRNDQGRWEVSVL